MYHPALECSSNNATQVVSPLVAFKVTFGKTLRYSFEEEEKTFEDIPCAPVCYLLELVRSYSVQPLLSHSYHGHCRKEAFVCIEAAISNSIKLLAACFEKALHVRRLNIRYLHRDSQNSPWTGATALFRKYAEEDVE